ncbi:MAG: hypothetical protein JO199_00530 [Candidatus Eremiobacteraeota bacterium]|nr:hypothetical protein [Candidatus Eremiobacteraeota bacterium]
MIRIALTTAAIVALAVPVLGATTSPAASPPPWLDPFCAVHAEVAPWNATTNAPSQGGPTSTYRVQLISQSSGSVLDAHLSLADDANIYNAHVRSAPLTGKPYQLTTPAYLVTLPKPVSLSYAWVASFYVDDAPQVACPTEVTLVRQSVGTALVTPPDAGRTLTASLTRTVGALSCGTLYTAPIVAKGPPKTGVQPTAAPEEYQVDNSMWQPLEKSDEVMGVHRKATANVIVFLDLEGMPVNSYVAQSTGVDGEDKAALAAADAIAYKPATFLCSPTVGHYVFEATFQQ